MVQVFDRLLEFYSVYQPENLLPIWRIFSKKLHFVGWRLLNPKLSNPKSGVEKFMVEKSGAEESGVGKFKVEKSGIEMSFNRFVELKC